MLSINLPVDTDYNDQVISLILERKNKRRKNNSNINDCHLKLDEDMKWKYYFHLLEKFERKDFVWVTLSEVNEKVQRTFLDQDFIVRRDGIEIQYSYFGSTKNRLKSRSCLCYNIELGKVSDIVELFGKFNNIENFSKRQLRQSMLISPSDPVIKVDDHSIELIDDVNMQNTTGKWNFTDGSGYISRQFLQEIYKGIKKYPQEFKKEISEDIQNCYDEQNYHFPSAIQIRLKSYKGMLVFKPDLEGKIIQIRPSMDKYEWTLDSINTLSLVGISKPSGLGALNEQFVQLLSLRGIDFKVFEKLIREYFSSNDPWQNRENRMVMYFYLHQMELLRKFTRNQNLVFENFEEVNEMECLIDVSNHYIRKMKKGKLCIPMVKSRNLYGVPDQFGQLEPGQCFIKVTIDGEPKILLGTVVVCKCPCYYKGDVRILEAVDVKKCHHLTDVIVFPTKGPRPNCDEIGGGDLDGDKYFVSWDTRIIPRTDCKPLSKEVFNCPDIPMNNRRDFFFEYNSYSIGLLDSLNKAWFQKKGDCKELEQIARLFIEVVDGVKSGKSFHIPRKLKIQNRNKKKVQCNKDDTLKAMKMLEKGCGGSGRKELLNILSNVLEKVRSQHYENV